MSGRAVESTAGRIASEATLVHTPRPQGPGNPEHRPAPLPSRCRLYRGTARQFQRAGACSRSFLQSLILRINVLKTRAVGSSPGWTVPRRLQPRAIRREPKRSCNSCAARRCGVARSQSVECQHIRVRGILLLAQCATHLDKGSGKHLFAWQEVDQRADGPVTPMARPVFGTVLSLEPIREPDWTWHDPGLP